MKRRKRSIAEKSVDLIDFFQCRDRPSHSQITALYSHLSAEPERFRSFVADDRTRAALQANFERGAGRIVLLLRFGLKRSDERAKDTARLSLELLEYLLAPLLGPEYDDCIHMETLIELFCSAVELNYRYQKRSWIMTTKFAERLLEKTGFLEILVSDTLGHQAVVMLLGNLDLATSVPERMTRRFAQLAENCPAGHRMDDVLAHWYALSSVYTGLKSLEAAWDAIRTRKRETAYHDARVLRLLSPKDERGPTTYPATTDRETPEFPTAPASVTEKIDLLGMQVPKSGSQLLNLLEVIRNKEIPLILKQIVSSFPCRECFGILDLGKMVHRGPDSDYWREGLDVIEGREVSERPLFGKQVGVWKILFSAQALQLFRNLSFEGHFGQVESQLMALASGRWTKSKMFAKAGTLEQRERMLSPLLLALCDGDLKILWQIDVGYHEGASHRQLIKVWTLGDQYHVDERIEDVLLLQRRYNACGRLGRFEKPLQDEERRHIPRSFPTNAAFFPLGRLPTAFESGRRAVELSNKFYAFTEPVLSAFNSRDTCSEFPFEISEEETHIVKHFVSGTLIIGRSGTGKTTCLLYRLLRRALTRRAMMIDGPHIRQILVTRSRFLALKMNSYLQRLLKSQVNDVVLAETKDDVSGLGMYDAIGVDYGCRAQSLLRLPESDYPLVCSFDELLNLIEGSLGETDRRDFLRPKTSRKGGRGARLVDYRLFKTEYWAKLPEGLTGGMVPALVFSTIMGIIKGSASGDSYTPLTRAEYMALGTKLTPSFASEKSKNKVYDIFESYERIKTRFGDRDAVDRVRGLLLKIKDDNTRMKIGNIVEELYVDEIQDQTSVEIILLLQLVRNPKGIHMAGDTAQNISNDSTFRFQDVKRICYDQFAPAFGSDSAIVVPEMFTLYQNYRSHQGIIGLASFIMKLLYDFYPSTVDKLPLEEGQLAGPKPLIFSGFGVNDIRGELKGMDASLAQSVPDFGAEQVVLVRDEETKIQVQEALQDSALVLTILDSKGMEFDDVLLLDFFSAAICTSGLQQLLVALKGGDDFYSEGYPEMCSELKNLYVAVTRPRSRLWLVESVEAAVAPVISMLTEFSETPLIEVVRSGDQDPSHKIREFRPVSDTDSAGFSERGFELLRRNLYQEALLCFRNANNTEGMDIAQAHILVDKGRNARGTGKMESFRTHFGEAIDLFRKVGFQRNAADCLEDIGNLLEAAQIWEELERFEYAAELYIEAKKPNEAVRIFHAIGNYEQAAATHHNSKQYNEFAHYIVQNREHLLQTTYQSYVERCATYKSQNKIRTDVAMTILSTLDSDGAIGEFLKTARMAEELAQRYKNKGTPEGLKMASKTLLFAGLFEKALEFAVGIEGEETTVAQMAHYYKAHLLAHFNEKRLNPQANSREPPRNSSTDEISNAVKEYDNFVQIFKDDSVTIDHSGWNPVFYSFFAETVISSTIFNRILSGQDIKPYTATVIAISSILEDLVSQRGTHKYATPWLIFMGLYPSTENPDEFIVLEYSSVREKVRGSCTSVVALKHSVSTFVKLFSRFTGELNDAVRSITESKPCRRCRMGLLCKRNSDSDHRYLAAGDCDKKMGLLLSMGDMYAQVQALHSRGAFKPQHEFTREYRGALGRWIEMILLEILYPSHYTNSSEVSMQAVKDIVNPKGRFHGLMAPWEEFLAHEKLIARPDFTSIMTGLLLCDFLDFGLPKLVRRRGDHFLWRVVRSTECTKTEARCLFRLRILTRLRDANTFRMELSQFFEELRKVPVRSFSEMHSFLFTLESITTQLIYWVCHKNRSIILPKSWIGFHMPGIAFGAARVPEKDGLRIFAECLLEIVAKFSRLLIYLGTKFSQGAYNYTFGIKSEKRSLDPKYLEHRLTALLTVPMLNIAELAIRPNGAEATWRVAQTALRTEGVFTYATKVTSSTIDATALKFHNSYTVFGDKEYLVIVNTGSSQRGRLGGPAAKIRKLKNHRSGFLDAILTKAQGFRPEKWENQSPDANKTLDKPKAAIIIQKFWRERYQAHLDRQEETESQREAAKIQPLDTPEHPSPDAGEPRELKAAVTIQKFWRKRYPVLLGLRDENKADETKAPKEAAEETEAQQLGPDKTEHQSLGVGEPRDELRAAVVIQRFWRKHYSALLGHEGEAKAPKEAAEETEAQQLGPDKTEHQSPGVGEPRDELGAAVVIQRSWRKRYSALLGHEGEAKALKEATEKSEAQQLSPDKLEHPSLDASEPRDELKAALIIQKFWRKRYPALLDRRGNATEVPEVVAEKTEARQLSLNAPKNQSLDVIEPRDELKAAIIIQRFWKGRYSTLLDRRGDAEVPEEAAEETKAQHPRTDKLENQGLDAGEPQDELRAAIIIQRFWKKCYRALLVRREEAKPPKGAEKVVGSILEEVKGVPTDVIEHIRTTAVKVYIEARDARQRLRDVQIAANESLDRETASDTRVKLTTAFERIWACGFGTECAEVKEGAVERLIEGTAEGAGPATAPQSEDASGEIALRHQTTRKVTEDIKTSISVLSRALAELETAEAERRVKDQSVPSLE